MMKLCALVLLFATTCQGQSLTVKKTNQFTKPISVSWTIDEPSDQDWIGIYRYIPGDDLKYNPYYEGSMFWTYACGTQDPDETCEAISDGTVVFDGVDPVEENSDQWPINYGMYKVCHFREGEDDNGTETADLLQPCKKFNVRLSGAFRKNANKASVEPVKSEYEQGETIDVQFNTINKAQNSWIGIYKKGEKDPEDYEIWLYTGCNNVIGDQKGDGVVDDGKSNDCINIRKTGVVTFNEDTLYRNGPEGDWPLSPGEYTLKLHYKNNSYHNLFKDSKQSFTVVEDESVMRSR